MASKLFDSITVNLETGDISYPALPGFTLDMDAVYRVAKMFLPFAGSIDNAVKHAIHGQLSAHVGMMDIESKRS